MGKASKKTKMEDDHSCCDLIMCEIAEKEERRLIRTLFIIGPLLIICTWLFIVAVHLSIIRLLDEDTFTLVYNIGSEGRAFSEYTLIIANLFWSQMRKDLIVLLLLTSALVALIVTKTKLYTFPFRFREIKKYKKNLSLQQKLFKEKSSSI